MPIAARSWEKVSGSFITSNGSPSLSIGIFMAEYEQGDGDILFRVACNMGVSKALFRSASIARMVPESANIGLRRSTQDACDGQHGLSLTI
jgi:hypothetical protein